MAANQPPLDFTKTQRVVLLIDLHPLLTRQNPKPYLTTVLAAASSFLNFPPLSTSLFAYKLFFSSLSPLRSASTIPSHLHTPSLSFNLPSHTLASLSSALSSFPILTHLHLLNPPGAHASLISSSLLQLIHDYAWESENENLSSKDCFNDFNFCRVPSNLVLLFSPVCRSINYLYELMELRDSDVFSVKFEEIFCGVREVFITRDIHLSWINVKSDEQQLDLIDEKEVDINECGVELAMFEEENRKMGWGFCSSDLIVFGSALLPFGLIYPKIGLSFDFVEFGGLCKGKRSGQLSLEILDVNGKPLQCKCLDLELVKLKSFLGTIRSNNILSASEQGDEFNQDAVWGQSGDESIKLQVKAVQRCNDSVEIGGCLSDYVIVRECSRETQKSKKKSNDDTFADMVLEMLHGEIGGNIYKNQMPIWQIILSFLHREGYWAIVSLSNNNGDSSVGILKPFTAHLAILSIIDDSRTKINGSSRSNFGKVDDEVRDTCTEDMNDSNGCIGSQTDTSTSGNCEPSGDRNRKRKKSKKQLHQDTTWSSFCQAVLEGSQFDLLDVYISGQSEMSKKLKFLKCWMKQICKVNPNHVTMLNGPNFMEDLYMCHGLSSELSRVEERAIPLSNSEISETFFNNLPRRIENSLESGMDLQNLAERVVESCIHFLDRKCEIDNDTKDQTLQKDSTDSCDETVGAMLMKLVLKEPKKMKKIHQDHDPSSKASDLHSTSANIVREYEFQILLRMEILRLDVSVTMEQASKQKLVKQICSLLEIIQYLMEGGIHGHVSLYDYVERTIKARYINTLEDVVHKIYTKMDLLPFGDEEEVPSLLFNSEDSNQPWREKHERLEKAETNSNHQSVSAEDESLQPPKNVNGSTQASAKEERDHLFNEARERRERARRFGSFTSWMPDLQRVWAPKQPKAAKAKPDSLPKKSKRKDRQKTNYSVVHETPMTGNMGDKDLKGHGSSSHSVSKALFQDD